MESMESRMAKYSKQKEKKMQQIMEESMMAEMGANTPAANTSIMKGKLNSTLLLK
jgi:hypothetical protein